MSTAAKISVAMTTYNGEKYVESQLQSILTQTLLPDEVIICDDVSTDNTVEIIKTFISSHKLDNWYLFINNQNLGWRQNFRNALSKTSGEIIFFADQDDIWLNDKIEHMSTLMYESNMGCLYGHAQVIDSDNHAINARNERLYYTGKIQQIAFKPSFYMVGALGCCMCVRRRVLNKYLELNVIEDDHDSQCPRLAILYDTLYEYDRPVIQYRIHQGNNSGISSEFSYGASSLKQRIKDIEIMSIWLEKVRQQNNNETQLRYINRALVLEKKRLAYLRDSKIFFIHLFKYFNSYTGIAMLIGDFAYKHNINRLLGKIRWNLKRIVMHK